MMKSAEKVSEELQAFLSHLHHVLLPQQSTQPTMIDRKLPFDLQKCARPNILQLQPYRCAREYVANC